VLYFKTCASNYLNREKYRKKGTIGNHFEFIVKHVLYDETFFSFILDQVDQSIERYLILSFVTAPSINIYPFIELIRNGINEFNFKSPYWQVKSIPIHRLYNQWMIFSFESVWNSKCIVINESCQELFNFSLNIVIRTRKKSKRQLRWVLC